MSPTPDNSAVPGTLRPYPELPIGTTWQAIVVAKDAEIARLKAEIQALRARYEWLTK